jgi:transcription elongation factor GreA
MHDQLTEQDLREMQEELDWRRRELTPKLLEEVKTARAFGDLSENFEYKAAKQEKNRNESRIRYLERMIKTAKVIPTGAPSGGGIRLFDQVTVWIPDDEEEQVLRLVTTLRQDPLNGLVSKESPIGKALLGRKVGETVRVQVNDAVSYDMVIRAVEHGEDDANLPISNF